MSEPSQKWVPQLPPEQPQLKPRRAETNHPHSGVPEFQIHKQNKLMSFLSHTTKVKHTVTYDPTTSKYLLKNENISTYENLYMKVYCSILYQRAENSSVTESCPTLCDPMDGSPPVHVALYCSPPLSMEFSRQEYRSG